MLQGGFWTKTKKFITEEWKWLGTFFLFMVFAFNIGGSWVNSQNSQKETERVAQSAVSAVGDIKLVIASDKDDNAAAHSKFQDSLTTIGNEVHELIGAQKKVSLAEDKATMAFVPQVTLCNTCPLTK